METKMTITALLSVTFYLSHLIVFIENKSLAPRTRLREFLDVIFFKTSNQLFVLLFCKPSDYFTPFIAPLNLTIAVRAENLIFFITYHHFYQRNYRIAPDLMTTWRFHCPFFKSKVVLNLTKILNLRNFPQG